MTRRLVGILSRQWIASADYMAGHKAPGHIGGVADWDWLVLAPVQNVPLAFTDREGNEERLKPQPGVLTNDAQALFRMAKAGAGLAVVPDFLAEEAIASGEVEHVLPQWELPPIEVYAVWPENAPKHGLVHRALDALSKG